MIKFQVLGPSLCFNFNFHNSARYLFSPKPFMFFMGTMEIYSPFPKCIPCLSKNKKRKRYIFSFGTSRAKGYVYISNCSMLGK